MAEATVSSEQKADRPRKTGVFRSPLANAIKARKKRREFRGVFYICLLFKQKRNNETEDCAKADLQRRVA